MAIFAEPNAVIENSVNENLSTWRRHSGSHVTPNGNRRPYMKITNGNSVGGVRAGKPGRSKAASGTGFGTHLGGAEAATPSTVASAPTGVGALLAAQSVGDALDGRARAYDHAEALLQRLDGFRLALLDGAISDAALQKLAGDMDGEKYNTNDPLLDELVAEIELRAAVELAKRNLI